MGSKGPGRMRRKVEGDRESKKEKNKMCLVLWIGVANSREEAHKVRVGLHVSLA